MRPASTDPASSPPSFATVGTSTSGAEAGEHVAENARADDDDREGHTEDEDRDEGNRRDRHRDVRLERPPADPHHRFEHDGEHRRLEPEEQRVEPGRLAERRVERREDEDDDEAGDDEQRAGDETAARAMEEPADIGRELLRLGTREQHAEVEGVQEARLGDPLPLLDQHRDA